MDAGPGTPSEQAKQSGQVVKTPDRERPQPEALLAEHLTGSNEVVELDVGQRDDNFVQAEVGQLRSHAPILPDPMTPGGQRG